MQFSAALLGLVAAFFATVTASPVNGNAVAKRQDGQSGVFLCTEANFEGHCVHIVATTGECIDLGDDLDNMISSFGPDQDANACRMFFEHGCVDDLSKQDQKQHFDTMYPGFSDLNVTYPDADNQISSYRCGYFTSD